MSTDFTKHKQIILFDGVCKLCNGWSQFIIKHDCEHHFKLASVQSSQGQALLAYFGLPTETFDTMLYIEEGVAYTKSEAFLRAIKHFPQPWSWLVVLRLCPLPIRDWLYDRIAQNRYRLFGQYKQCMLPSDEHKAWFLTDDTN